MTEMSTLELSDHVLIQIARLDICEECGTFEDCIIKLIEKYEEIKNGTN